VIIADNANLIMAKRATDRAQQHQSVIVTQDSTGFQQNCRRVTHAASDRTLLSLHRSTKTDEGQVLMSFPTQSRG